MHFFFEKKKSMIKWSLDCIQIDSIDFQNSNKILQINKLANKTYEKYNKIKSLALLSMISH